MDGWMSGWALWGGGCYVACFLSLACLLVVRGGALRVEDVKGFYLLFTPPPPQFPFFLLLYSYFCEGVGIVVVVGRGGR